jgi:hypothetical protein
MGLRNCGAAMLRHCTPGVEKSQFRLLRETVERQFLVHVPNVRLTCDLIAAYFRDYLPPMISPWGLPVTISL